MAATPAMRTFDFLRVPQTILRTAAGLLLGLGVGASFNCTVVSVFTCTEDASCVAEGGEGGVCEPNSLCTFPDADCPNGKRWHDRAGDELASKCYDPSDLGGGTDSVAGTAGSSSGTEGDPSTSGPAEGSTTLPADDSSGDDDDSSGSPPPVTDDGGSSSGGMAATCMELFGAAPGYIECEDTETTCSFNATLAMTSCDAMCMMFGGTCAEAFTNDASDCASMGAATTCDDATANDHICVCNKP